MAQSQLSNLDIAAELAAASKILAPAVKRLKKELGKLEEPDKIAIGLLADTLYDLEQLSKQMKVLTHPFTDVLEPAVKKLEEHFINKLAVGESSGVQGKKSRVQISDSVIPTIEDWSKFYAHIAKTKEFELLNRAPNRKAISERWDVKKEVPGVGKFHAKKVSCTKLGGK